VLQPRDVVAPHELGLEVAAEPPHARLALVKFVAAAEVSVMKAHLHFVISEAVVSGEVTTRDWPTIEVPDLLALNAAAATAADGAAEGGTPNAVRFAPVGGTVDTAPGVVREAAPGGASCSGDSDGEVESFAPADVVRHGVPERSFVVESKSGLNSGYRGVFSPKK